MLKQNMDPMYSKLGVRYAVDAGLDDAAFGDACLDDAPHADADLHDAPRNDASP